MPDSRFFHTSSPIPLGETAALVGATLVDSSARDIGIASVTPLARAALDSVTFFSDRRYLEDLRQTEARACFVTAANADALPPGCIPLVVANPHAAFALAADKFYRPHVHPVDSPTLHPTAEIGEGVVLAHRVVIGPGVKIGAGSTIGANTVIGPGVCIGRDCQIGANVVMGFALIGDRVKIFSGAVIGEAGFGVTGGANGAMDVPQLGRAILQDGVTLGALSCVDRGAWDDTVIGENTKIDNMVQIAHNVRVGRNCMFAAQVGISGSTVVGDGAVFGGRAGFADHLTIGAGARIAALAGVMKDVPAGETWCGAPARPIRRFMRETAWVARHAYGRTGKDQNE